MVIQKGEAAYFVRESEKKWTLKKEIGKITVSYSVPKTVCSTFDDLREYVLTNDIF